MGAGDAGEVSGDYWGERIRIRMMKLYWTKERPTEEGHYWYRQLGGPANVVHVIQALNGRVSWTLPPFEPNLESGGEWAGPIPEPEERLAPAVKGAAMTPK